MPRPATDPEMREYALSFAKRFIKVTGLDNDIIPKKGRFSPFGFFCKVLPACVKVGDGGSSAHGITQAAFNKALINELGFTDGMRSTLRNTEAARTGMSSSRHYLRCRWITPVEFAALPAEQVASMFPPPTHRFPGGVLDPKHHDVLVCLLGEAFKWSQTIGAAGRGGDRSRAARGGCACLAASTARSSAKSSPSPSTESEGGSLEADSSKSECGALAALLALASSQPTSSHPIISHSPSPCPPEAPASPPTSEVSGDASFKPRSSPDPMDIASLVTAPPSSSPSPSPPSPASSQHSSPAGEHWQRSQSFSPLSPTTVGLAGAAPNPRKRGTHCLDAAEHHASSLDALVQLVNKRHCHQGGLGGGGLPCDWQSLLLASEALRAVLAPKGALPSVAGGQLLGMAQVLY
mmetsp:Transcript_4963/g.11587  ORF Transcript_4963/g.11587 Transcript_4963/m.11587 type:complete len:407 (-) Transcript_4963:55-1275(-)|eukprot:CAMPEP_0172018222 /NCGR_PEP_ID=MMETSP1041-20130122/11985_1 /TAXON_ID=464988 /ORGANISM="Hemiselmis andersenii, Strain CCMP439" /LENGTH=406 /DNA_ID=CAMNT_0012673309 /DNA_START=185 /DNA_END=1405 /DNA_ORIENTATION=-